MRSRGSIAACLLLALSAALTAAAAPRLRSLDIDVRLSDNGDARITEVRQMDIDSQGTECYIVVGNLSDGSELRDVSVTDETGLDYTYTRRWKIDATRQAKTGKCGLLTRGRGYEVCWGLGSEGRRTYRVSYTVTRLAGSYQESDGFVYMFVAKDMTPSPESVSVSICRDADGTLPADSTRMWAFGFKGSVGWNDGKVVATSDGSLSTSNYVVLMVEMEKGVLHPERAVDATFSQAKERAFEGSDYDEEDPWWHELAALLTSALFLLAPLLAMAYAAIKKWRYRRKVKKDLLWHRDLPYGGSLVMANGALNSLNYFSRDYQSLISATVLRLIERDALTIGDFFMEPTGLSRLTGGKGGYRQMIVVKTLRLDPKTDDEQLMKMLHDIFSDAAGNDQVLQPNELKMWMRSHHERLAKLMEKTMRMASSVSFEKQLDQVRQVMGLKKFLQDFTLANERHVSELKLWKEYLIYAELFGIADQVRRDMKTINPDYMKMDETYRTMMSDDAVPQLLTQAMTGSRFGRNMLETQNSRSSGGGGFSSIGGGGGFSGGGSGGGIRCLLAIVAGTALLSSCQPSAPQKAEDRQSHWADSAKRAKRIGEALAFMAQPGITAEDIADELDLPDPAARIDARPQHAAAYTGTSGDSWTFLLTPERGDDAFGEALYRPSATDGDTLSHHIVHHGESVYTLSGITADRCPAIAIYVFPSTDSIAVNDGLRTRIFRRQTD